MKKVWTSILSLIIIVWLLVIFLSSINLSFFGIRIYRVGSQSMAPSLQINDIILIKRENNYKIGDIITYKEGNQYITHRIVSMDNEKIITKGDSNNTEDKNISKNDIVGKVIYKFKLITMVRYMLDKKFSWIAMFVISAIIMLLIPVKIEE